MTTDLTAIVGGTVIDGTGRPPILDALVVIAGERIVNVARASEGEVPDVARVVDATGKFLIPGLIDAHAHIVAPCYAPFTRPGENPLVAMDVFMRGMVGSGITGGRDPGNFDAEWGMKLLRRDVPEWPRGFGAGPIIDGPAPPSMETPWEHVVIVDEESAARDAVRRLAPLGVDFIKVYVWLREPVLRAVVEEAHSLGLAVAAHVGHTVTAEEAVKAGVDSLEHVRMGRELMSTEDLACLRSLPDRDAALDAHTDFRSWRFIDPESSRVDDLIGLLYERGVFLVPTLTIIQTLLRGDVPAVVDPPENQPLPGLLKAALDEGPYTEAYTSEDFRQAKEEFARLVRFVARAHQGGVKVVAGTDFANPFVGPAALHEELRLLVEEAGMSPMEALVAATRRGSEILYREAEFGTIEKRKLADIVVLDGDPLSDIRNTKRICAVYKGGKEVVPRLCPPWPGLAPGNQ